MKKTTAAKALPAPEKPKGVQFLFIPETKESRPLGWPTAVTAVVAVAVNEPRETSLTWQPVKGGMVLVDDVDVIALLDEASKNGMNTSLARQQSGLKAEFKAAMQAYGARVSEYTQANTQRRPRPAVAANEAAPPETPADATEAATGGLDSGTATD